MTKKDLKAVIPNTSRVVPAPDGRFAVVFHDPWEMTMMNWSYRFSLLDSSSKVVQKFEGMDTFQESCAWSGDSAVFAVPGTVWGGVLLWDVRRGAFAVVRTSSRQFVFDFDGSSLRVRPDPAQLAAINADGVFGGGKSQLPVARYKAPAPSLVDVSSLKWHDRKELSRVGDLAGKVRPLETAFLADGFFPFTGKVPASTADLYNGRKLETFQLEVFAEFGDKQSQAWLAEVKKKLGEDYNGTYKVAKVIGLRKRTLPD